MKLGTKIFASFSLLLLSLLGITQYITNTKTEAFEVAGITHQLELASDRFRTRLESQRDGTTGRAAGRPAGGCAAALDCSGN